MTYDAKEERYRLYVRRDSNSSALDLLATCGSPEALGVALVTMHTEDELSGCTVGILDRPDPDQKGEWIVSPFGATRKRRFPPLGDAPTDPIADA